MHLQVDNIGSFLAEVVEALFERVKSFRSTSSPLRRALVKKFLEIASSFWKADLAVKRAGASREARLFFTIFRKCLEGHLLTIVEMKLLLSEVVAWKKAKQPYLEHAASSQGSNFISSMVTVEEASSNLSKWIKVGESLYQHLLSEAFRKLLHAKCRQSTEETAAAQLVEETVLSMRMHVESAQQVILIFSPSMKSRESWQSMEAWEVRESLKILMAVSTSANNALDSMGEYKGPRIFYAEKRRVRKSIQVFSQKNLINGILADKIIPRLRDLFESENLGADGAVDVFELSSLKNVRMAILVELYLKKYPAFKYLDLRQVRPRASSGL